MYHGMKIIRTVLLAGFLLGVSGSRVLAFDYHLDETRSKGLAAYAMGVMYDLHGMTELAIEQFQTALSYQENYAIYLRLGADYARLGKLSEAILGLTKALELDPDNVQARYLLALIYSSQKKYDEAALEYEKILTSFAQAEPENVEIYGYLAQLYYSQKQYDKAIKQFEAVLTLQPQNTDIMFLLGALYLETGAEDKAVDLFSRTIKLAPDHDSGLNSLGYIYAERGEQLDEAQSLIERALKIDPDNGAYLDSMGWVYFKKDQYQKALDYLYQAEEKLTDPVIFEHLGDVYWKMNNQEQAKLYWEKSLELLPGQQKVLDKLQQIPGSVVLPESKVK